MIQICPKDCPHRRPGCHGSCPDYPRRLADYTRLNDSRFDGVWSGRNEMIVQSGDTVWVFTYYEMETAFSREDLLRAVAERQSK